MDEISTHTLLVTLAVLLVLSGFFSIAETSMMALNRYRMKHLAKTGHRGARLTAQLLARPDRLLGVVLLGNNLINSASAALVTYLSNSHQAIDGGYADYAAMADDHRDNEFAGACFDPSGRYLFVNIQTPGVTFAITGPWDNGAL